MENKYDAKPPQCFDKQPKNLMRRPKVWTPTFEEFKKRKDILSEILRKQGCLPLDTSPAVLRVRHQIQNALHEGYFVNFCCDSCHCELYCEDPHKPSELMCPGCGWEGPIRGIAEG